MTEYYSLLRISPKASKLDIINAYRQAKLTYRKDSLAVYSLYSEEELTGIRQEIDKAYNVLSDREKRRVYDAEHGYTPDVASYAGPDDVEMSGTPESADVEIRETVPLLISAGRGNVVPLHRRKQHDHDPDLERRIQSAEDFPGGLLREVREYRGIALQEVADHTRISITYLQAIENEDVKALPGRAYLKGYVGQYAAEIGLEAHRVVQGYPPLSVD